jgi:hypothetical protein
VVVKERAPGAGVAVAFPLQVARVSPPQPEHVGLGSKPLVAAERKPPKRKAARKVGLAPLVGESFPK